MALSEDKNRPVTFTFPGQGSYSHKVLRELYTSCPQTVPYFHLANEIGRDLLNGDFLPLVTAASDQEHDERLNACPDLDQLGIYVSEVLIAKLLLESGIRPDLLVGHSFGELAALATAGAYSVETGLRIVCHRILALQSNARPGAMAAISCDCDRARRFLEELGNNSVEISVVNHPRQTVLSGAVFELEELRTILNRQGVSLTILKSRYPYHSSFLSGAVTQFRHALEACEFRPAAIPVYLCMESMLYSPGSDLSQILSSQFIRPLDFASVVTTLYQSGYRTFIECGAGNVATSLIEKNLANAASDVVTLSLTYQNRSLREGLVGLLDRGFGEKDKPLLRNQGRQQWLEGLSLLLSSMFQLVENSSRLIEQVAGSLAAAAELPDFPQADDSSNLGEPTTANPALVHQTPVPASHAAPAHLPAIDNPLLVEPGQIESAASGSNGSNAISAQPARVSDSHKVFPNEDLAETPVAIVSMGCVLPGALDPEQYWSNILEGVSGISNLADIDPSATRDFVAGNDGVQIRVTPDKTYTLLHGSIVDVPYDAAILSRSYGKDQFDALTRGQKLLALAVAQSLSRLKIQFNFPGSSRVQCIIGATADGSKEYDEAVFLESLETIIGTLDEPESLRRSFVDILEEISGYKSGDSITLTQHKIYCGVIERLLGSGVPTYVVDTACSSSLYSTYLGMRALQDRECDVVLAGGVFAPGPANNTLFAQFRGLTHHESRPFDASADGVVFGDGAGILILKRLPDALVQGDRILAVIRGIGLSSDGKSPSINVPQVKGQILAIRNAYEHAGVDLDTIQYVEAHATATLVGDAVEFKALSNAMKRDPASPNVELGSVKALIGHTGWAAGVASTIKICKAFETRVIPRQYNYLKPSPEIDLAHSRFTIPETSHAWPDNVAPYPRRAAINGFGFGGTNAHLILEDFDEPYHRNLCGHLKSEKKVPVELAVLSVGSLFPGAHGSMTSDPSSESRFSRESLRLPARKMLLPDVTEHMDPSQYLAALAAEKAFSTVPEGWMRFKDAMAVVLGLESKTERGVRANERVFVDRLRRQVLERRENGSLSNVDRDRILDKLVERIRSRNVPSGPYTLPGLMPNVTAGRIANMFDLNGPNIVVDVGDESLLQSLFVARQLLAHDACKIVLAGGVNANSPGNGQAEAVLLLALTTPEIARREGLPVLSTLKLFESDEAHDLAEDLFEADQTRNYKGAQGAPEILKAILQTRDKGRSFGFKQNGNGRSPGRRLVFVPPYAPEKPASTTAESSTYAYVQGTPIGYYTPQLIAAKAEGEPKALKGRRILFLTDRPDGWLALEDSGALSALEYNVVCPASAAHLAKSLPVDLKSDESIRSALGALEKLDFDIIIAIKALDGATKEPQLLNGSEAQFIWLDLFFAVCRHSYERIQRDNIPVISICQDAYRNGELDTYTGLVSGFVKSLSRELDGPICRAINTDETDFFRTLRQVEIDLGHPGREVEACYSGGARSTFALAPVQSLAADSQAYLDSDSVVIATGGARGVTAVLVEELLRRFGCRVIAMGRTDPSLIPEEVRQMDVRSFENYEAQFYRDELARNGAKKITDLKREYLAHRAANEVCQITKQLQAIPGRYEYHRVDITSEAAVDRIVEDTYRKYGRVDMVLHGAGIQVSKALTKKSLSDFREIIATKLGGLRNLYKACEKYRNGRRVHFHILTSVFSYMGNDGQPDYGAANEAMNRIAASMDSPERGTRWSSMAWLGWAGIGMTRNSEFAALAAARRLRGVTKEEGQKIFSEMMMGTPAVPINILLADGEIDYYKVAIQSSPRGNLPIGASAAMSKQDFHVMEREISIEGAPYLLNHLVDGVPTLPGAFIIYIVGEAAHHLRPELKIVSFEKALFRRFIRVYKNRKTRIRIEARIVSEHDRETIVQVRVVSDFVHSSGVILQKEILQHEILVRMSPTPLPAARCPNLNGVDGRRMLDPYMMDGSPVCLSGPFKAMENIVVGGVHRRADYKLADINNGTSEHKSVLSKIVLMDSLWRFGVIQVAPDNSLPVFVPEECEAMKVYFDFADFDTSKLSGMLTFTGANPRLDGERLSIGPIAASDSDGNTLLVVEGGVCRRFGAVGNGAKP